MNRQNYDDIRRLQLLMEILDDLLDFWVSASGKVVDADLLGQFEWAINEAYADLAQLLVTYSPATPPADEVEDDG
jgi:hypothetical protein